MDIQILGTTANEGWPALWCDCSFCRAARTRGNSKDLRTRSSAMVDEVYKFDWPPDTLHHLFTYGLELHRLRHLIFTHGHDDHFYGEDLGRRCPPYAHVKNDPGLDIWAPVHVIERLQRLADKCHYRLHVVKPFHTYQLGDAVLTPLEADHSPGALLYLFTRNGKTLFYGHDSGYFPETTWEHLKGKKLDVALLDCTNGLEPHEHFHMGIDCVRRVQKRLAEIGCLHDNSQVIATHFSHNGGLLHDELVATFAPDHIQPAYDGMCICV